MSCTHACVQDGGQTVSRPIKAKLVLVNVAIVALMVLAFFDVLAVLTALTWLSFIKLGITIVKYCPQALMNYRVWIPAIYLACVRPCKLEPQRSSSYRDQSGGEANERPGALGHEIMTRMRPL